MIIESRTLTVPAAGQAVFALKRAPWSVAVFPGAGATASVEISASSPASIAADPASARWVELETGITDESFVAFPGPATALRLKSSGGETVFEVLS